MNNINDILLIADNDSCIENGIQYLKMNLFDYNFNFYTIDKLELEENLNMIEKNTLVNNINVLNCNCVIYFYDRSNINSFNNVIYWNMIIDKKIKNKNVVKVLSFIVSNNEQIEVTLNDYNDLAVELNIESLYFKNNDFMTILYPFDEDGEYSNIFLRTITMYLSNLSNIINRNKKFSIKKYLSKIYKMINKNESNFTIEESNEIYNNLLKNNLNKIFYL